MIYHIGQSMHLEDGTRVAEHAVVEPLAPVQVRDEARRATLHKEVI